MNHPSTKNISKADAQHVLFFFGNGGVQPGSFTTALLEAMARADSANFTELALAFPGICAAWRLATKSDDGVEVLREIANEKLATVTAIHQVN
jgi:hypothetical protein